MDLATLRRELAKQPFRPFRLRLSNGSALPVNHPDFIAIAPPREVMVGKEDGGYEILDLLHVVAIDRPQRPRQPKEGNGPNAV